MNGRALMLGVVVTASAFGCQLATPDLFAHLPKTIGGETMTYADMTPVVGDFDSWQGTVLRESGHDRSDMTAASGFTSPPIGYGSFAVRIKGMRGEDIIPLMMDASSDAPSPPPVEIVIEGRRLTCVGAPGTDSVNPADCVIFFYVLGDATLLMTGRENLIREAVRQLP